MSNGQTDSSDRTGPDQDLLSGPDRTGTFSGTGPDLVQIGPADQKFLKKWHFFRKISNFWVKIRNFPCGAIFRLNFRF